MRTFTEDEAKELWCPFSQAADDPRNCIASGCMMWEEYHGEFDDEIPPKGYQRYGYCGLKNSGGER